MVNPIASNRLFRRELSVQNLYLANVAIHKRPYISTTYLLREPNFYSAGYHEQHYPVFNVKDILSFPYFSTRNGMFKHLSRAKQQSRRLPTVSISCVR